MLPITNDLKLFFLIVIISHLNFEVSVPTIHNARYASFLSQLLFPFNCNFYSRVTLPRRVIVSNITTESAVAVTTLAASCDIILSARVTVLLEYYY